MKPYEKRILQALKTANVSIHVIATGAGAELQSRLWQLPGSSAYLSGATFPYATEEQIELLGFTPDHYCSQEAAIDLASVAYMRAYKFGSKKPVGVGITASVASEKIHRGEHQIFVCVITDDKVLSYHQVLEKGVGIARRYNDGSFCSDLGLRILADAVGLNDPDGISTSVDATELAKQRLFARPFFTANGQRLAEIPNKENFYAPYALMSGAFNPPHEGHFGPAQNILEDYGEVVVFEVTAQPPHKEALSVQQLLQRVKLLQGHNRIVTPKLPYYLDKAKAFPGIPLVMGADAMVRILDPQWGVDITQLLESFRSLHTKLYIISRDVNGKFTTRSDIEKSLPSLQAGLFHYLSESVRGEWHLSSTEIRNKLL